MRPVAGAAVLLAVATLGGGAPGAAASASSDWRGDAAPQGVPPCVRVAAAAAGGWQEPLDRAITLRAAQTSLRDALARVAAAGRFRLSYSADLLPLDRGLCFDFDGDAAGDALVALLAGSSLRPVVAGSGQVVLAPANVAPDGAARDTVPAMEVYRLERIVVTGTVDGSAERQLPVALTVLTRDDLDRRADGDIARALRGTPGVWLWEQPSTVFARYGSIRGASSFGASYPKVYIDGIEVANPLLVTRLPAASVDHVELIRGPQGSALYGTDAISGVANVVLRHDAPAMGAPRTRLWTSAGLTSSAFADASLDQDHHLAVRLGSATRSAALDLDLASLGAYVPGAYSRDLIATGTARLVRERTLWTGVVRAAASDAERAVSPLLARVAGLATDVGVTDQSVRQLTAGVTARYQPDEAWEHAAILGLDAYSLDGATTADTPFPSAADSALEGTAGDAARLSLRLNSVRRFDLGGKGGGAVTMVVEHSELRQRVDSAAVEPWVPETPTREREPRPGDERHGRLDAAWRGTTGLALQLRADLRDRLFLSGGLRLERNEAFDGRIRETTLPMVGAAWLVEADDLVLKLRGAYGRGIRWPETPGRLALWEPLRPQLAATGLEPEEQRGIEVGADLYVGDALTLRMTRFDQLADGLIQRVTIVVDSTEDRPRDRIGYVVQNVGEIENDGWEMQATLARGALSLSGALTLVDSRVRRLAFGYDGDLRPGDRMLEVPARTLGVVAAWTEERWSAAVSAQRAFDWIDYDRVALARAVVSDSIAVEELVGRRLRNFWLEYEGSTWLRLSAGTTLRPGLEARLTLDNLLDRQRGEPDNVSIVPGRTVGVGVRLAF